MKKNLLFSLFVLISMMGNCVKAMAQDIPDPTAQWSFNNATELMVPDKGSLKMIPAVTGASSITLSTLEEAGITQTDGPTDDNKAIQVPAASALMVERAEGAESTTSYTIMMDMKVLDANSYDGLIQTNKDNDNDGDLFIHGYQIGMGAMGGYFGNIKNNTWYRIILTNSDGKVKVYVNGEKLITCDSEGRWEIDPWGFYLFCDEDGEKVDTYVSGVAFWETPLTDEQVGELGAAVKKENGSEKGSRYYKLEFTATQGADIIQLEEIDLLDADGNPIESMKVYKDSFGQGARLSDNNMDTKWGGPLNGYAYILMDTDVPTTPAGYRFYTGDDTEDQPGRNPKSWKIYSCNAESEPDENAEWTLLDERTDDNTMQPVNLTPFDFMFPVKAKTGFSYYKLEFTATQGADIIQLEEIDLLDADGNPIETMKVYKDSFGEGPRLSDNNMDTKWGGPLNGYAYVLITTEEPTDIAGYRFYTGDDTESQPGRNPRSWKLYCCNADSEPDVNAAEWTLLDERTDDNTMQPVNLTPFDFMLIYDYDEVAYQAYESYAQEIIALLSGSEGLGNEWDMLKSYLEETSEPGNPFPNGSYPYIIANRQLKADEVYQEIAYLQNLYKKAQNDMVTPGFRFYKLEFTANMGDPVIQLEEIDLLDADGNPIETMKVYKDTFGQGARLCDNNMGTKWGGGFSGYAYVLMNTELPTTPAGYRFYTGDDTDACPGRNPKSWKLYGCFASSEPDQNANWTLLDEREDDDTMQPVNLTPFDFFFEYEYTIEPAFEQYQAYEAYVEEVIADLILQNDIEGEAIDLLRAYLDEESEPGNPFPNGSYSYIMAHMQLTANGVRQEMEYLKTLYDAAQNDPAWPGFRYYKLEFTATQGAGVIQLQEIDLLDAEGNPIETMKVYKDSFGQGARLCDNKMDTKWGGGFDGYAYILIDAGKKVMPKGYRLYTGDDTQTQSGRNPRSWKLFGGGVYSDTPSGGEWTVMDEHTDDYTMQPVNLTPFDFAINYIYTEEDRIAAAYEDYKAYAAELLAAMDELEATGEAAELLYSYLVDDIEPGETFANGSYNYIIQNEDLNAEQLAVEMAFMAALYKEVQAVNYGVGDVSFLLESVPFSQMAQEHGGGSFDDSCTLTNLKNGVYEVTMNGFFTIKTRENSRFYTTYLYAGDRQVPLMSIEEDYLSDTEVEEYGLNDFTFNGNYIPSNSNGARNAFKNGHYLNRIVAEVTDGTLQLGIRGLSTGNSNDWSMYGFARLAYLGEMANSKEAFAQALEGQSARAQALQDAQFSSGTDYRFYPNFSQALREQLKGLCETAQTATEAAAMYGTEGILSAIFPEVVDCQKAYIDMMNRADAYIMKLSDMMEKEKIGKTLFDYGVQVVDEIFDAYEEGRYSAEEARNVEFFDVSKLHDPLIVSAEQLSSNASDSEEGKDLGALIDDNAKTLWHSDFHNQVSDEYHYLQVDLEEEFMGEITLLILRPETSADHPTKMLVWGSEDGNDYTEIGTLDIPFTAPGIIDFSSPFIVNIPVNHLRIAASDCASTDGTTFRKSWQAVELQIYGDNYLKAGFRYYKFEFTANHGDGVIQLEEIDLLDENGNPIEPMTVYKDNFGEGPRLSDNDMGTKWGGGFTGFAYVLIDTENATTPAGYRFYTGDDTSSRPGRNPKNWKLFGGNTYSESPNQGEWTLLDERTDDNTMQAVDLTPFDFAISYQYVPDCIRKVQSQEKTATQEGIYDLMGRKLSGDVEQLSKGLYIINGKKVLVK